MPENSEDFKSRLDLALSNIIRLQELSDVELRKKFKSVGVKQQLKDFYEDLLFPDMRPTKPVIKELVYDSWKSKIYIYVLRNYSEMFEANKCILDDLK